MQPDFSNIPLHDIHLPPPVSWWPPALGWWLLLLLLIAAVALTFWQITKYRRFKLRRTSIKELNALYKSYQNNYDAKRFVRELSVLLRRICISYFPQGDAAGLAGNAWLAYLDSLLSPKYNKSANKFSDGIGTVLISAPYRNTLKDSSINVDALYQLSSELIFSLGPVNGNSTNPKINRENVNTHSAPVSNTTRSLNSIHAEQSTLGKEAAHVSI